ncbi:hypothetical protein A5M85_03800 [Cellulophaga lytica]|uniref:hypothetical protein n=1 Tax=Cellulophaga lytica TaxID=979 RepID=UPI00095079E2|nr:hypothetical protein [Cellulophaga lytica]APU09435.1 hypothetical protein A5M85_03800 [Cellulophaga lytica]
MGNKIITEKDFWRCSGGLMPSPFQSTKLSAKKQSGEKYVTKTDTSTIATMDFSCKWIMLIAAIIAAIVAVAIVATGGAALGAIVAAGAMAGAAGAIVGAPLGSLVCGQRAAIARTWNSFKGDFKIQSQEVITGKDTMTCAVFGSAITFAPEIKNWAQAYTEGGANLITGVLQGMLAGAGIGMLGGGIAAFSSISSASASSVFSMNTLRVLGSNVARNWLSTVGLQTGGRLGLQLASKPVIAMAVGLRGTMGLESGLRSYSQNEEISATDIGKGLAGMELGTAHSVHNIATGNANWQDIVGTALWFMPFHSNSEKGKNKTTAEDAKNESTKQTKTVESKAKETKGEFEAYETEKILALPPPKNMSLTLKQVRRLRGVKKWKSGEVYVQELYGSNGQKHYKVPPEGEITGSGGRYCDAPVETPKNGTMALEVKTYNRYITVEGKVKVNEVPLSPKIRQQVLKDVYLRDNVKGYDPRWIFLDAPPSLELSTFLSKNRIISVIYQ